MTGLEALGLVLTQVQTRQLLNLLALVQKWGSVFNLTAIRDPLEGVTLHLLDSLLVSSHLGEARRILDVATGAGFPGLPLAIAHPERNFCLLDRSAKKIRFVRQAILELGLPNVEAVASRIEDYRPEQPYDAILARAFAPLSVIWNLTRGLISAEGRVLALKGQVRAPEWQALEGASAIIHPLALPGSPATRHVVEISESGRHG